MNSLLFLVECSAWVATYVARDLADANAVAVSLRAHGWTAVVVAK